MVLQPVPVAAWTPKNGNWFSPIPTAQVKPVASLPSGCTFACYGLGPWGLNANRI